MRGLEGEVFPRSGYLPIRSLSLQRSSVDILFFFLEKGTLRFPPMIKRELTEFELIHPEESPLLVDKFW